MPSGTGMNLMLKELAALETVYMSSSLGNYLNHVPNVNIKKIG